MQVKSIAECSKRAFCNTFDLHLVAILSLRSLFCLFLSGRLRQVSLYFHALWIPAAELMRLHRCADCIYDILESISNELADMFLIKRDHFHLRVPIVKLLTPLFTFSSCPFTGENNILSMTWASLGAPSPSTCS